MAAPLHLLERLALRAAQDNARSRQITAMALHGPQ